jgi:transcriptional regulator of NAD metabolism
LENTMNLLVIPLLAMLAVPSEAASAESATCASKRASIEQQVAHAERSGELHKVSGLTRALKAVQENCTDAALEAERRADVQEAEQKVREREAELAEEEADGTDQEKLAKRRAKLDEAKAELEDAKRALTP